MTTQPTIPGAPGETSRRGTFPTYRQFDVLACADCDTKFINTARNGKATACRRCGNFALVRWRPVPDPTG